MTLYTNAPNGASGDDWQNEKFKMDYFLSKVNTALPVKVLAVKGGGISPVGYVDVKPMVRQMAVSGRSIENPVLHNVPYFRLQGGTNAVVIDPEVGDIGIAVFAQRDISSVKRTRADAGCGSLRMHDLGDAMYIGGILNQAPSQYIQFTSDGIKIFSPSKVTVEAPEILLDSPVVKVTGNFQQTGTKGSGSTFTGGMTNTGGTVSSNGIVLDTHVHSGVEPGGGNTGGPV